MPTKPASATTRIAVEARLEAMRTWLKRCFARTMVPRFHIRYANTASITAREIEESERSFEPVLQYPLDDCVHLAVCEVIAVDHFLVDPPVVLKHLDGLLVFDGIRKRMVNDIDHDSDCSRSGSGHGFIMFDLFQGIAIRICFSRSDMSEIVLYVNLKGLSDVVGGYMTRFAR